MGNQNSTTTEICEWCEVEKPSNQLRKIYMFWGWCYQTICTECEEKYPVNSKVC